MKHDKEYFRIHNWISYHHGKANKCENENCESVNPKRFEWALLKGKDYAKNRNNYIMLCPSCHRKYDYTDIQKEKQSLAKKGVSAKNKICVCQYDLNGVFIKKFNSYTEAAKEVGGIPTAFCALRRGRLKTYKSFLWKF
ncbi:MAG: hypothetical protein B7Y37_13680 [Sphingobacteriia bacterium 28-36-52]|nr:MAG: hypothetical protein B7Y37_13680 [Sphingobacteriia bacterium 28-36-52]